MVLRKVKVHCRRVETLKEVPLKAFCAKSLIIRKIFIIVKTKRLRKD